MGWVIGTLILWGLKLVVVPLARVFAGGKAEVPVTPAPAGEAAIPLEPGIDPVAAPPAAPADDIPTGAYIIADVIVLGIAGLLLGIFTGSYFIGFSWKARDWPGMIVFILTSLMGSAIHG